METEAVSTMLLLIGNMITIISPLPVDMPLGFRLPIS